MTIVGEHSFFAVLEAMRAGGVAYVHAESEDVHLRASMSDWGDLLLTARDASVDGPLLGAWEWVDGQGWTPTLVDDAMTLSVDELDILAADVEWRP